MKTLMTFGLLFGLFTATTLTASPIHIDSTPQQLTGPFRHNVFHDNSGHILAYMDLDTAQPNWYDPMNGNMEIQVNIYSDSGLTNLVGTAHGSGANLVGSAFDSGSGDLVGTISWDFTMADANSPLVDDTLYFTDRNYVTSSGGHTANSWENGYLTLWGGNNWIETCGFHRTTLGMDLVLHTVPEPGTLLLLGAGFGGLVLARRRRNSSNVVSV